jgi:hypothetical protein
MSNNLKIGDLVVFNTQFASYIPFPLKGTGIVSALSTRFGQPSYDVLFPIGKVFEMPRFWIIKVNTTEPEAYCPIEEEWKMWGTHETR